MEAVRKEFFTMSSQKMGPYTIADIEALPQGDRAELLDGEMFMMASPSTTHQAILGWLHVEVVMKIREKGGKCRVFPAPFAVHLMNDDKNYVEPDLSVMCNRDKLDDNGYHGAPDWIVEIISPSSRRHDCYRKLNAYMGAGVREYWIIDPEKKTIIVYKIEKGEPPVIYSFTDTVEVGIFENFFIDFAKMADYEFD